MNASISVASSTACVGVDVARRDRTGTDGSRSGRAWVAGAGRGRLRRRARAGRVRRRARGAGVGRSAEVDPHDRVGAARGASETSATGKPFGLEHSLSQYTPVWAMSWSVPSSRRFSLLRQYAAGPRASDPWGGRIATADHLAGAQRTSHRPRPWTPPSPPSASASSGPMTRTGVRYAAERRQEHRLRVQRRAIRWAARQRRLLSGILDPATTGRRRPTVSDQRARSRRHHRVGSAVSQASRHVAGGVDEPGTVTRRWIGVPVAVASVRSTQP